MSHPSARLLFWLLAIVALQYLDWVALGVFALVLGFTGQGVRRRWCVLVRRARFLLLTLWLILAYGTPGDAWRDLPWAPTEAGIYEATIHAVRLMVMLGSLGWLFESLPKERLMAGLWSLVQPLRYIRVDADRIVVRLALVFDYVEKAPPRGSWRRLLDESGHGEAGPDRVRIELPAWRAIDTLSLVGLGIVMAAGVWLG